METTIGTLPAVSPPAPAPVPGPHPGSSAAKTAGAVLIGYLRQQLQEIRRQDPLVRDDQPDAVHQMRTSTRRLRSALATGRKLFDDGAVPGLRSELKWLSEVLGAARDPEVVQEGLNGLLAREPEALLFGPAALRIDEELSASSAAGRRTVLEALDGDRYPLLLSSLERMVTAPSLSAKASGPGRQTMRKLLAKEKRRLRRTVQDLGGQPDDGAARDAGLHEIRKAAKRVRYAAEAASPVAGKKAGRTENSAHEIQKILGLHQDSVVARALLADLGGRALRSGENGFTYGRLHAAEEALGRQSETDFFKVWKKFR
jgi:CHAD domain-containing protein